MSYLDQLDDYTRASLDGGGGSVTPRTDSRTAATTEIGSHDGGAKGGEDAIRRYTERDGSEDADGTIVGARPDSGGFGTTNRTSGGEGRYNKRLGILGNHSLPVVALGVDPSDDGSPPPPLPKNLDPDSLAPDHLDFTPSPGSEDLTFDLGNLTLASSSSSNPQLPPAASTLPPRSDSIPSSLPPIQSVGRLALDDDDGGIRAPSNTNRGSIWDPNLGSGLRGVGSRTPGSAGYDDLRRRASANSAMSEGTRGTANLGEVERRDSLQSTLGGAVGSTSERGSLAGAEDDLALAAAMLQKRGSTDSESFYETSDSRRESANTNAIGGGVASSSSEPLTNLPPRGPSLPSNPAATMSTPRMSDSSRMQSSPYASAGGGGGTGSSSSSIRQSAEASGSASGHAAQPSYPANYPADDNMSVMGGHPGYGGAYAGYPGAVPPSAGAQHDYDYAYFMQQQQAQAMAAMHPGFAQHPQQAWFGHPQYAADPAAAAYYQQQQAAAYQASMAGYPAAGYYGHEYAAAAANPYYAGSMYGGYAPSAYAGGSSGASVVGVSGQMANIPRRRGPASIASSERDTKAPERERVITKQSIDEYRNRIKNDQDPEAHFNFAKYLIEAAKKFGAAATSGEDANSKALRKYRDALLAESLKLIRRLATQGVGLGKPAYADAQFFLANCLGNGSLGLQPDHEKAYNLYVQASKQNHPQATYRTAVCNERGAGTRRDHNRAVLFYRKASALGDTPGMYKLGMILLNGLLGQQRNVKEAVVWLKRAASQADEENPHALFELGQLLENPPREIPWVRQLITDCRDPDPMVVEASAFAAARDFYTSAGQFGHDRSQHRLGQLYEYGKLGCPIDPRRSIAWYTRAAERGLDQAELSLSGWYLTGAEGVLRQSDNEAYLWARRAANKGLPEAELAVGVYYERGIGVDRDLEEAKKWFMRAAAQGNRKAMQRLTDLRRGDQPSKRGNSKVTRQQAEAEGCTLM